jgi:hypothetical protein
MEPNCEFWTRFYTGIDTDDKVSYIMGQAYQGQCRDCRYLPTQDWELTAICEQSPTLAQVPSMAIISSTHWRKTRPARQMSNI